MTFALDDSALIAPVRGKAGASIVAALLADTGHIGDHYEPLGLCPVCSIR